MPVRERVFGGSAGFWLRKRKNLPASSRSKPTTAAPSSDNVIDEHKQQFHIGWDEERCRPIYESVSSTQTSSASSDEEQQEELEERRVEEEESPTDAASSDSSDETKENRQHSTYKRSSFGNMRPRKPRSTFGSQKRWPLLDFDVDSSLSVPKRVRVSDMSNSTVEDTDDKEESSDVTKDPLVVENTKPSGPPAMKRRIKKQPEDVPSSNDDASSVFEFSGDDSDNKIALLKVRQPTSKTSLTVARAFFEQLDSNCALTLDSSRSPDLHKASIRTRRKISLHDPVLVKEYQQYCTACKDADVDPLSIQHFLAYRSNDKTTLYDGFLDE